MRINYDHQMTFGTVSIDAIEFDIFSRHGKCYVYVRIRDVVDKRDKVR